MKILNIQKNHKRNFEYFSIFQFNISLSLIKTSDLICSNEIKNIPKVIILKINSKLSRRNLGSNTKDIGQIKHDSKTNHIP
ncbi:TPA: hypothetical protein DEG21_02580 [Patescibacteria group bacterium]|nr:hypothetical protein [Candidatus Gracilibacteria bacterium]HBY74761.1 hypothetical protein [Candidatus Gracilibacteria bacterium]